MADKDFFFEHGVDLESRTIDLCDDVTPESASKFVKGFHLLEKKSSGAITVRLNSEGGDVYAGLAIYNVIRYSRCHITCVVLGQAMSMASVILQAADVRQMYPCSVLMLHDGTQDQPETHVRNLIATAAHCENELKMLYEIYAKATGQTPSYWKRKIAVDMYLLPEQALKEKLIDAVLT